MVKSGLLKDRIDIFKLIVTESDSGNESEEFVKFLSTRCELLKSGGEYSIKDTEINKPIDCTIKVRYRKGVTEDMRIYLRGSMYEIAYIYHDYSEMSLIIDLIKVNGKA